MRQKRTIRFPLEIEVEVDYFEDYATQHTPAGPPTIADLAIVTVAGSEPSVVLSDAELDLRGELATGGSFWQHFVSEVAAS